MKSIVRVFLRRMSGVTVSEVLGPVSSLGVPIPLECRLLHAEVDGADLLLSYERRHTAEMPVPLRYFYVVMYDQAYPDEYQYVSAFHWDGYTFHLLEMK